MFTGMARVFFTDAEALTRTGAYGDVDACERTQRELGLAQRMPFLLDDDGTPLRAANRWLASLPSSGCSSPRTWKAYALDLCDWHQFLSGRGRTVLDATREDLAAYHADRRLGDGDPSRALAPSSWNRKVAALDSFYAWAVEEQLIDRVPFTYRHSRVSMRDGGEAVIKRNMAKEKTGRSHATLKWLEQDQLHFFLDVGMTGLLPSGEEDPDFRGRNAARNRAVTELLATAGLRAQEASYLLAIELPAVPAKPTRFVRMALPAPICKGKKARFTLVPPDTLRSLHGYMRMERDIALADSDWQPSRPLTVSELDATAARVDGRRLRLASLSVEQRERLVLADGGSPLLALQSTGAPMTDWEQVFAEATARCRRFDAAFPEVTPHTMRHTFAVHMLRFLIEQVAEAVQRRSANAGTDVLAGYWRAHDPLLTLRDLLGHASVSSTQIYLDAIDATRLYAQVMDDLEADLADNEAGEALVA